MELLLDAQIASPAVAFKTKLFRCAAHVIVLLYVVASVGSPVSACAGTDGIDLSNKTFLDLRLQFGMPPNNAEERF